MSMTTCRGCGQPLAAGIAACTTCGVRVNEPAVAGGVSGHDGASLVPASDPIAPAGVTPMPAMQAVVTPVAPAAYDADAARALVDETYASIKASQGGQAKRIGMAVAIALVVGLIARVALGAMAPEKVTPEDPGELVAQLPVDASGGSAKFDGGGKVSVPKGAVQGRKTINVYRRTLPQRITLTSATGTPIVYPPGTLVVYQFGPFGLTFLRPIVILLPIPPGQDGIVFVSADGAIRFLPGVGTGNTVRLTVTTLNFNLPGAVVVG